MNYIRSCLVLVACTLSLLPHASFAADAPDTVGLIAAQRKAVQPLAVFDGMWRGPAKVTLADGKEVETTQTERVGSILDGSVKVIEGRGYTADGTLRFNAFAVLSYSPQTDKYNFRSYAQGYSGDFPLEVRPDGFTWSIRAGPATIRYTATVKDGTWTEFGERIVEGQPTVRIFQMTLRRIGSTDWPAAGAVPPQ